MEYSDEGEAETLRSEAMRPIDETGFACAGCHTSLVERQTFGSHR